MFACVCVDEKQQKHAYTQKERLRKHACLCVHVRVRVWPFLTFGQAETNRPPPSVDASSSLLEGQSKLKTNGLTWSFFHSDHILIMNRNVNNNRNLLRQ